MNLVSDLLLLASTAALAYAVALAVLRLPLFPLRDLAVHGVLREVTPAQLEYAARSSLNGNFFTVNLDRVRTAFSKLPWVRRVEVRRRWPDGLELDIEEHTAVARWRQGEGAESRLVNDRGEVFAAASNAPLPLLAGPDHAAPMVLARYREFAALLEPIRRKPQVVALNAREAWQLRLDDGLLLELGRDQPKSPLAERLKRFSAVYGEALDKLQGRAEVVDLRYPNGFALRAARGTKDTKGKQ